MPPRKSWPARHISVETSPTASRGVDFPSFRAPRGHMKRTGGDASHPPPPRSVFFFGAGDKVRTLARKRPSGRNADERDASGRLKTGNRAAKKKSRRTPADRDPLPAQRGAGEARPGPNLSDIFERIEFLMRFPLGILKLLEAHRRVLGALLGSTSQGGPPVCEEELAREFGGLATEDELRARLTAEELDNQRIELANALEKIAEVLSSGQIGELTRRWWVNRKVLDTQKAMKPTKGMETLAAYEIVDVTPEKPIGELKLKAEYADGHRPNPRLGPKGINAMAAARARLRGGERQVRKLVKDRVNVESVAPKVLNPHKK